MLTLFLLLVRYEAEDAEYPADVKLLDEDTGFSGTGYLRLEQSGQIKWTVSVSSAGFYNIIMGFYTKFGEKTQKLEVNDKAIGSVSFAETSGWTSEIIAKKVKLNSGTNTVTFLPDWGYILVDYIEVESYVDEPFNIDSSLVTPNPSAQAKELYDFLKSNFEKKIISGVMTLQGNTQDEFKENDWVYEKTGKYPVIVGLDFMHQIGKGTEWYTDYDERKFMVVNDAEEYYKRGGIPTVMWHWRDPSNETQEFYSPSSGNDATEFDAARAADSSTQENKDLLIGLEQIAAMFQILKERGVPVLWRPFHEASGGWFWWGYAGAGPLKKLWKIMFDYFVKTKGLNNLIWVWTSGTSDSDLDWYPGDDYVDIVGADIYPDTGDHSSQAVAFNKLKDLYKGRKIIALTECGSIPAASEIVENAATWSFFMPWYREYTIADSDSGAYNGPTFWKTQMSNSFVLSLSDMPGWKSARRSIE